LQAVLVMQVHTPLNKMVLEAEVVLEPTQELLVVQEQQIASLGRQSLMQWGVVEAQVPVPELLIQLLVLAVAVVEVWLREQQVSRA
jgi:hypothetical protein